MRVFNVQIGIFATRFAIKTEMVDADLSFITEMLVCAFDQSLSLLKGDLEKFSGSRITLQL